MAAEDEDDAEGCLLADFRRGQPGLPIAVSLDLHANITAIHRFRWRSVDVCAAP
jgi:microcystin degradation protein MlrC